jgi:hypothetical protein
MRVSGGHLDLSRPVKLPTTDIFADYVVVVVVVVNREPAPLHVVATEERKSLAGVCASRINRDWRQSYRITGAKEGI